MQEKKLIISKIQTEQKRDGTPFYKIYFKNKTYTWNNPETNLPEQIEKVHFIWPDTQAFNQLQSNQIKTGMTVDCQIELDKSYLRITSIEISKPQQKTL